MGTNGYYKGINPFGILMGITPFNRVIPLTHYLLKYYLLAWGN